MSLLFRQHVGSEACWCLALQKTVVRMQVGALAATSSQSLEIHASCRHRCPTVGGDAPLCRRPSVEHGHRGCSGSEGFR